MNKRDIQTMLAITAGIAATSVRYEEGKGLVSGYGPGKKGKPRPKARKRNFVNKRKRKRR